MTIGKSFDNLRTAKLLDPSFITKELGKQNPGATVGTTSVEALSKVGASTAKKLQALGISTIEQFAASKFELPSKELEALRSQVAKALAAAPLPKPELSVKSNVFEMLFGLEVREPGVMVLSGQRDLSALETDDQFWENARIDVTVAGKTVTVTGRDIWTPRPFDPLFQATATLNSVGVAVIRKLNEAGFKAQWGNEVLGGIQITVEH